MALSNSSSANSMMLCQPPAYSMEMPVEVKRKSRSKWFLMLAVLPTFVQMLGMIAIVAIFASTVSIFSLPSGIAGTLIILLTFGGLLYAQAVGERSRGKMTLYLATTTAVIVCLLVWLVIELVTGAQNRIIGLAIFIFVNMICLAMATHELNVINREKKNQPLCWAKPTHTAITQTCSSEFLRSNGNLPSVASPTLSRRMPMTVPMQSIEELDGVYEETLPTSRSQSMSHNLTHIVPSPYTTMPRRQRSTTTWANRSQVHNHSRRPRRGRTVSESAAIDVENVWQRAAEHESEKNLQHNGSTSAISAIMAGVVVKSMLSRQNSGHNYL